MKMRTQRGFATRSEGGAGRPRVVASRTPDQMPLETGLSQEEAEMAAFELNSHDLARLGGK